MPDAALTVRSVGFAAVKGTRHLARREVVLDERGAVGDRSLCFVDVERARVLRTIQHPGLLSVRATLGDGRLTLDLPERGTVDGPLAAAGERLACDYWGRSVDLELLDGPHATAMSEHLGRPVRLARAPRGAVVFADPVTLVGTASLRDLAERVGDPAVSAEAARFRPTLVVDTDEPYVEESWTGAEVQVGGATLRVGVPIPRCAVIDHHPDTGVKDRPLLRALAGHRPTNRSGEPMFGVFAQCVSPGVVRSATA